MSDGVAGEIGDGDLERFSYAGVECLCDTGERGSGSTDCRMPCSYVSPTGRGVSGRDIVVAGVCASLSGDLIGDRIGEHNGGAGVGASWGERMEGVLRAVAI